MPIARRKPFLIQFSAGETLGRSKEPVFSDFIVLHAEQGTDEGNTSREEYGVTFDYDKVLRVNATKITRNINQQTIFFINEMPTANFPLGDYTFVGKSDEVFGNFNIYLKRAVNNNIPVVYYLHKSGMVCSFQLNFDADNLIAYVPMNKYLPFNEFSTIWKEEPATAEDTENRIELINREIVGYTENSRSHLKLTFKDIV